VIHLFLSAGCWCESSTKDFFLEILYGFFGDKLRGL
jgi:hypothetical protein